MDGRGNDGGRQLGRDGAEVRHDSAARPWRSLATQRTYDPPTHPPDTVRQDKGEIAGSNPAGRIRARRLAVNGGGPRNHRLVLTLVRIQPGALPSASNDKCPGARGQLTVAPVAAEESPRSIRSAARRKPGGREARQPHRNDTAPGKDDR